MYYLGIDGGGTKTLFVVVNEIGEVLLSYKTTTSHYLTIGYEALEKLMDDAVNYITTTLKIKRSDIVTCFLSICGYGDIKEDDPFILEAVTKGLDLSHILVKNDTVNALYGALKGEDGINIISGTGSIALGIRNGRTMRTGGWHHSLLSDEGSGYWLSLKMIHEFTRQSDKRDERTKLYYYLKEKLNLEDDASIISLLVNKWHMDRTKVASLSPLLYDLAKLNDPYALVIYDEAIKEYLEMILPIHHALGFKNKPCLCSATGGVFNAKEFTFLPLKERLASFNITLVEPFFSPILGSALLALKMAKIELTDEIFNNLKRSKL